MLKGKTVVLGVTGSIAAYKTASLASMLVKLHAQVHVIMTENALHFVNPITFETLTGNKCLVDTFDRNFEFHVEHVSLGKKADVMMIAPASANVIGKLACGIADDMLTTTALACRAPVYVAPAMNTAMYEKPVVQDNLERLKHYGMYVVEPDSGYLACGDTGAGKMPEPEILLQYILREIACPKDLKGKNILVTAGPTREAFDPVRFITNHSSGKMGYSLAKAAMLRGANVTLVSGPVSIDPVPFVDFISVVSAADMAQEVFKRSDSMDYLFLAAAVADYTPTVCAQEKVKKTGNCMQISLSPTKDILKTLGAQKKEHQVLCGFCMETEDLLQRAAQKRVEKNADMIVANNLRQEGAGFGTDTNVVTLISDKGQRQLPLLSKDEVAHEILNEVLKIKES
ncbi:MAG: bifunctional phosphopantothenoylcysteine decarboxylase/phosphopantothenate--cysteine ligase CoaBC [Lachnospiraceae bacterium]